MYKGASRNAQRRADRILMKDMPSIAAHEISPRDEQEAAKKRLWQIDYLLKQKLIKEDREELGLEKLHLQNRLKALKEIIKADNIERDGSDMNRHIIEAAKKFMKPFEFDAVLKEARRTYDEFQAKKNQVQP